MILSIIIPVYNTDPYIFKKCVDSVLSFCRFINNGYELIIVDDGSYDEYAREYLAIANTTEAIRYLRKKNSGVSSARNEGIRHAKGEYLLFVDSDDALTQNCFNCGCLQKEYDVVVCDYLVVSRGKTHRYDIFPKMERGFISPSYAMEQLIEGKRFNNPFAKFFKKSFITKNKIVFNEEMINGEDADFNANVLKANPTIYYLHDCIYSYSFAPSHFDDRVKKHFDEMMYSYLYRYYNYEAIIEKMKLPSGAKNKLDNICIETLYRMAMICAERCMQKEDYFSKTVLEMNINYEGLSICSKAKYRELAKKKRVQILLMSKIRKMRMKLGGVR